MTHAHEAIRQDVKQEAADEFVGIESHYFFSIPVSSIPVVKTDLAVLDVENAVVGERDAVGVAAEVIEHGLWRTERLFGVNHPVLFPQGLGIPVSRWDFSFITGLL